MRKRLKSLGAKLRSSKKSKELIPTVFKEVSGEKTETVNAKNIYDYLQVKKDFSDWIKNQIKRAGLLLGKDYVKLPLQGESQKHDSNNINTKLEYFVTVDSAKHIGMMSLMEKGREIRDYFIERDKKLALLEKIIQNNHIDEVRARVRLDQKKIRLEETDTIKLFVDYAKEQGSKSADKYYMIISKMENQALFYMVEGMPKPNNIRDVVSTFQLFELGIADKLVSDVIKQSMEKNMYYKDIFQACKKKVEDFAMVVGKTPVLEHTQYSLLN